MPVHPLPEDDPFVTRLGTAGPTVSRLTPAAMSFAGRRGPAGGSLPADGLERAVRDLGIRSILVTPRMKEQAEGVRRLIRAGHRDRLTLVSLMGIPTRKGVERYWQRCTRALETDRIEVYLVGWVQYPWYVRPSVWKELQSLKADGRVGAVGFSIHNRQLAARLVRELDPPPDVLMIRYNAAHRGAETEVFAHLPEPRPGIIAYTATRWGELLEPRSTAGFPSGMTAGECYRFDLMHPAVDTVLCGARSYEELAEDVAAVRTGPLDPHRFEEVVRFGETVHQRPARRSSWFMFDRTK